MEEKIISIIASELEIDASDLNADSSSQTVEGWDSLAHMGILEAIESEFAISLPIADAAEAVSVEKLTKLVKSLV